MSRAQARFIIALTVMVSLIIIGYQLVTTLQAQRQNEQNIAHLVTDVAPEAAQRMQDFRRAKIRDGKKVWEIAARQASYSQEKNEIIVEGPEVTLYAKNGDVIALRCQEGRVHLNDDEEVIRMELSGDLEMRVGDFVITTPNAVYENERNAIFSDGPVRIVGQGVEVEGQGYTVDVAEKRLTLNAEVSTTITRGEG
ncbi:MAG: LPS export ABC transporter periplasmic protein LptC [Candidatus Binatia bacterium]